MADCGYYRESIKVFECKGARADRGRDDQILWAPWCSHPKHARVHRWSATATIGGEKLLKCSGKLAECPLGIDDFDDV